MKMTRAIHMLTAAAVTTAFALPYAVAAQDPALVAEAKIGEAQATSIALAKVPSGTVKSSELEKEHGKLVWSFDIASPSVKGMTEILIDAKSGKIVSVKRESAAEEAKEAKADLATRK